jgi:peptidoglycan/xylan/chitin deacetylase (PgdA/CDA1 family)
MSRRWHWDFEDEPRPPRPPDPPPPPPPPLPALSEAPGSQRARIRRRRGGALLALALVAALIFALAGSADKRRHAAAAQDRGHARSGAALGGGPSGESVAGEQRAVAATLAYTPFVRAGGPGAREVALTFDDGPGPYTPAVLGVLEQRHVHATFFVIGKMERYFASSTERALRDGNVVGDHTETHPQLARLSGHEQREQLLEQAARVELLGGPRPRLFRPPYGSFNATTMRLLRMLGMLMVLWSVDTQDYLQPGVPAIVQRVLTSVQPGAIVLMHDGGGDRSQTVAALPLIIRGLHDRGYHLVTVPELLRDAPPPRGEPLPRSLSGD